MANNIEHQDKGELVANCDRLQNDEVVVTTPVESRIMSIRGKQIMIDRDLAELYGVETRVLNQAVKRNIERFPERFRFQLTKEECLRSQIATLNEGRGQHLKYMPYVFTENGVAMLSSVLRSDTAIEVNIRIMRAFTSMRHFLQNNAEVFQRLSTMEYHQLEMQKHLQESDKRIEEVFRRLDEGNAKPKQGVFYNGQIKSATAFFVAKYLCMRYFSIFNAKKAIFTLVSGRDGFLYHHRILLLQWNLLDTTLVTTALEGS